MIREIKFRFWDKIEKMYVNINGEGLININDIFYNENYILEQFTGLFDARGIPIYENDILEYQDGKRTVTFLIQDNSYAGFVADTICIAGNYVNVVGNIHE